MNSGGAEHHPHHGSHEGDSGEITGIIQLAESFMRYRWYVATIVFAFVLLGIFYASALKDRYQSSASILVDNAKTQTTTYREAISGNMSGEVRGLIDTQIAIATSMPVLLQAAKDTDAKTHYAVATDQQAAGLLQANTRSFQYKKTNIFYIQVDDGDAVWASKLANATAENFIEESLRQSLRSNQELLKLLPGGAESDPTVLMEKMADPYFIESLPSVQDNPTIQELKREKLRLNSELAQLKTRYTDENPAVIEMLRQIEHNEQQTKIETAGVVAGLKRNLASEFKSTNMSIFERAKPADEPFAPNRTKLVLVFGAAGIIVSFMFIMFMGALVVTVNSEEDLARMVNVPYLGHMPVIDSKVCKSEKFEDLLNVQAVRDSMAMLHTAFIFSMPKDRNKLIMITSCIPGEGKSSISALLAFTMANLGAGKGAAERLPEQRILLVEADIRRPGLTGRLDLADPSAPGLADYLTGAATLQQIIRPIIGQPNVDIISAGTASKNPEGLFTSKTFDELIKAVESKYERIIFDSPPFLSIPEAAIISQKMHGTLFVVGCGMLKRKVLMRAIEKLKLMNTILYGTILNRMTTLNRDYYQGYHYYSRNSKTDR